MTNSYSNAGSKRLFQCGRWHSVKVPSFCAENCHFAQRHQVSRMVNYMKAELANKHLAYGAADCSGTVAQCLYTEQHPTEYIPSPNFFASQHL